MKSRKGIAGLAILVIVAVIVFLNRGRIHFDWAMFWQQLRHIAWIHIAAGIALIYATYFLRAWRWSIFLGPTKKVSAFTILGPQFIGFTASVSSSDSVMNIFSWNFSQWPDFSHRDLSTSIGVRTSI